MKRPSLDRQVVVLAHEPSGPARTLILVSLSEAEFFQAGMSLPPDVRKHVALRLLGSVDPDEAFDLVTESWLRTEAAVAFDALKADPSPVVSSEDVRTRFETRWTARL